MAQLKVKLLTRQDAKLLGFVLAMMVGILVNGAVFRPHEMLCVWIDRVFSADLGPSRSFTSGPGAVRRKQAIPAGPPISIVHDLRNAGGKP